MSFSIANLSVSVNQTPVASSVSFTLQEGAMHVLMGPNGSGKSSLLHAIAGNPRYAIDEGTIMLDGIDITDEPPEKRARRGIFLAFQNPVEIPGVSLPSFLRSAANASLEAKSAHAVAPAPFVQALKAHAARLGLPTALLQRGVNEGFSGGEKKKAEILQMLALSPRVVLLDEIDSGLDLDAIETVTRILAEYQKKTDAAILWVTHNPRVLASIDAAQVWILSKGRIAESGGADLLKKVEQEGFARYE